MARACGAARQLVLLAVIAHLCSCAALSQTVRPLLQNGTQEYSCEDIGKIPAEQRCSFVLSECDSESRIPYTHWYYCNVEPHGMVAKVFFGVLLVLLLPLLFTALGDTAELYFSPTMAIVAQTIPGMRPRFAGVTFVAIGNGAPDLSANISALRTGQVALSAGAFTGAAMFVQCVVASEVIRISGGVRCRGATLRDVGVYAVCVMGVCLALYSGKVTRWFVAGTALAYLVYVIWVFAGDEWHARGRPELRPGLGMSWGELRKVLLERQYRLKHDGEDIDMDPAVGASLYADIGSGVGPGAGERELTEALLPWATIDDSYTRPEGVEDHGVVAPWSPAEDMGELRGGVMQADGMVEVPGKTSHPTPFMTPPVGVAASLAGSPPALGPLPRLSTATSAGGHATGFRPRPSGGASSPVHATSGVLSSKTYRQAVWADLAWEPTARGRRQLAVELRTASSGGVLPWAAGSGGSYLPASTVDSATAGPHPQQRPHHLSPRWNLDLGEGAGLRSFGSGPGVLEAGLGMHDRSRLMQDSLRISPDGGRRSPSPRLLDHVHGTAVPGSVVSRGVDTAGPSPVPEMWTAQWRESVWNSMCHELTFGSSEEWQSLPRWRQYLRILTFTLLLPVYGALRLTVPMADPETYNQQWLVASMLCSPLGMVAYFGWFSVGGIASAMVVGAVLACVIHLLTRDEMEVPALDCGTRFKFGPAMVSLAGFFMGVLWIDSLASEVVGVISLLSGLLRLPPSLVGLTLLTWGNSLGDYFGNQAMAKRGASSTALTACFAAPLFNMLISMTLGFSAYFAKEGTTSALVTLPSDAALGCAALVCYNAILAVVGLVNDYYIPAKFYLFARVWYGLYLIAAGVLAVTAATHGEG